MNPGQEKFYEFIMDSVEEENQEKAKELLMESFAKQNEGTFDQEYLTAFIPKMLQLIKPDKMEMVKNIMSNYKA